MTGDSGDIGIVPVAIPISPQNPVSPQRTKFGIQRNVKDLRKTRVILSGRAWEWWWWETDPTTTKKRRRTRYGGMFHKLSDERKEQYGKNRERYWRRKITAAARREADELVGGA